LDFATAASVMLISSKSHINPSEAEAGSESPIVRLDSQKTTGYAARA